MVILVFVVFAVVGGVLGNSSKFQQLARENAERKEQERLDAWNSLSEEEQKEIHDTVEDIFIDSKIKSIEKDGTHKALILPVFYNGPVTQLSIYGCSIGYPEDLYHQLDKYAQEFNSYYYKEEEIELSLPECYDSSDSKYANRFSNVVCKNSYNEITPIREEKSRLDDLGTNLLKKYCGSNRPQRVVGVYGDEITEGVSENTTFGEMLEK